ncbi:MAG TPA: 1,4-alpha-glucan branching protein GlgB [Xanthomonadaceae bacterium]|nr:1,4-alpha-glucan branching protein GlgB [Xanthomonadaceae bacterium]
MSSPSPDIDREQLAAFGEGRHWHAWKLLGAHLCTCEGVDGTRFAVWAPNADAVAVAGDFNDWNQDRDLLRGQGDSGVWAGFVAAAHAGQHYRFRIRPRGSRAWLTRADPYARWFEPRPGNAARIAAPSTYRWNDDVWMRQRRDWRHAPMAIYEVHAGSWRRHADGSFLGYRLLAEALVEYLADTGFTHVELLPVTEHPLDESWGYQTTGFFAPTSRFGDPDDFRALVDTLHRHGYGVVLDWVPGHFPGDDWALARYDGTALYEHEDPRRGVTPDWGTLSFNLGRHEVRSFLISSALYWLREFHIDGLRVDAVAAMLHLDFGRPEGAWIPNVHGGRENLEAIDFLRQMNRVTHGEAPGSFTIAEESSAWPAVTRPDWLGGLGFSMKWNMGWMHDTLDYMAQDPVYRRFHHDRLTFSRLYAFDENFVLPFSHDEVVHCKGSLLARMPGDDWQRFANLRLLFALQFTWPGKKLVFMGQEFAARTEWDEALGLDWQQAALPAHAGVRALVRDLSLLHRDCPALHRHDFVPEGFEWIDCHDAENSVLAYLRGAEGDWIAVILNFTPVPRHDYRIGLPEAGRWRERLNSDSRHYGGSDVGNLGAMATETQPWMGRPCSLRLTLPPLGALLLVRERA